MMVRSKNFGQGPSASRQVLKLITGFLVATLGDSVAVANFQLPEGDGTRIRHVLGGYRLRSKSVPRPESGRASFSISAKL